MGTVVQGMLVADRASFLRQCLGAGLIVRQADSRGAQPPGRPGRVPLQPQMPCGCDPDVEELAFFVEVSVERGPHSRMLVTHQLPSPSVTHGQPPSRTIGTPLRRGSRRSAKPLFSGSNPLV